MPRLAAQLNHLFQTVPRADGKGLWTNDAAAAALAQTGLKISAVYIGQLRNGQRDNPSARHLAALAQLFGVPTDYFFDPDLAKKIDEDLRLLTAIKQAGVDRIALRASQLSPESLSNLADMIEHIRRLEGLHDNDSNDGGDDTHAPSG